MTIQNKTFAQVELADSEIVELSYHVDNYDNNNWFVDIAQIVNNKGWCFLSKKDLEIILEGINELENKEIHSPEESQK